MRAVLFLFLLAFPVMAHSQWDDYDNSDIEVESPNEYRAKIQAMQRNMERGYYEDQMIYSQQAIAGELRGIRRQLERQADRDEGSETYYSHEPDFNGFAPAWAD